MSFDHGHPVEAICLFPSMSLIVSAGGALIKGSGCEPMDRLSPVTPCINDSAQNMYES